MFINLAIELSEQNIKQNNGGPFGAVITKNNEIISVGVNNVVKTHDPTGHAEINAIRNACEKLKSHDLSGCIMYTSCEPCPMCYSAIRWSRINDIYYANNRKDAAEIGFSDDEIYNEIYKIHTNEIGDLNINYKKITSEKAKEIFKRWKLDTNNVHY